MEIIQKAGASLDAISENELVSHPGLAPLRPYMQTYCEKGLRAFIDKKAFSVSAVESYSMSVLGKVSELDNSIVSLSLACRFILDLAREESPKAAVYRYHYENFVLRVVGVVDRAYRLAGQSLLLPSSKVNAVRGNFFVQQHVQSEHPGVCAALQELVTVVDAYKGPRNELIHEAAYSDKSLGVFDAIERFDMDTGSISVEDAKKEYSVAGVSEVVGTLVLVVSSLNGLLDNLSPFYQRARDFVASAP